MKIEEYLCGLTKKMCNYYLLNPTEENFGKIIETWSDNFSMIGTGKHEVYTSFEDAVNGIAGNQTEASQIKFEILDEWYQAVMLREDAALVYGGIWVRELMPKEGEALIEMDTRFSIIYVCDEEGNWKMVHLHHSMPYFDQGQDEFYPKALSVKVREAMELVELFKKRSEMDLMTGVYNHESFQKRIEEQLKKGKKLNLYILDLDNFKNVNDTYGHSAGDELLKYLAKLLQKYFKEDGIIGRIGGDEFAMCDFKASGSEESGKRLMALWDEYREGSAKILNGNYSGFSIGIAANEDEELTYRQLFRRADQAVYQAKNIGKDRYVWYMEK